LYDTTYFRRVVFSQACELTTSHIKIAVKPLPEPGFTAANACFPNPVSFSDTSTINQGNVTSRVWDFGDGSGATTVNPSHSYTSAGSYSVKLIVTSNFNCTDSITKTLVNHPKPLARFVQNSVCFPFAMDFYDSSTVST